MIEYFPTLRGVTTGDYVSAYSYMRVLAERSHWLYGQVHSLNYPFAQQEGQGIAQPIWIGETPVASEHMTLKFSARINLSYPDGVARLQYYRSDGQWIDIATDSTRGQLRFFGGVTENTIGLSSLSPANNLWTLRFILTGAGGWAIVYRAYLTGTTGFPTWPTPPTFTDGQVLSAADLNKLRTMQEYLLMCAKQPRIGACIAWGETTDGPYPLFRFRFCYGATKRLYYNLTTSGIGSTYPLVIYLEPDTYCANAGDQRIATIRTITSDVTDQGYNEDLSGYGLVQGNFYTIEFNVGQHANVTINNIVFADLGSVARTYKPKSDWLHGDYLTAAELNKISNDLNQMYPASNRESPLWYIHEFASWQYPDIVLYGPTYRNKRYRLVHRWRYLRYRGGGRIYCPSLGIETSLRDTEPPGQPQIIDLSSTNIPYGVEYYVESFGDSAITVAYEVSE
jgi:hypothetical protein